MPVSLWFFFFNSESIFCYKSLITQLNTSLRKDIFIRKNDSFFARMIEKRNFVGIFLYHGMFLSLKIHGNMETKKRVDMVDQISNATS